MRQMNTSRHQSHWDLRAAGNFICGGTGSGLVLACALAGALGQTAALPLAAGAVFVMLGLSLVWLEIGKPWRALNVFFHPQTSWMTREGILAGPLVASSAAAAWSGNALLLALAAVTAAGFLYCQARMLRASRAIPAWSHPRIVPLIVSTGLAEGIGVFLMLAAPTASMAAAALAAALLREAARERYRRGLVMARAPQGTLAWFARREVRILQGLRILAMALLAAGVAGLGWAAMTGAALTVLTGWALKVVLITRAAFTRGLAIPTTPARGRGAARAVQS